MIVSSQQVVESTSDICHRFLVKSGEHTFAFFL